MFKLKPKNFSICVSCPDTFGGIKMPDIKMPTSEPTTKVNTVIWKPEKKQTNSFTLF